METSKRISVLNMLQKIFPEYFEDVVKIFIEPLSKEKKVGMGMREYIKEV